MFIESWGIGTPVVLVHGSLATGADEWQAQRPLADHGYRLLVLDRRGYGRSPMVQGEDFLHDAEDIVDVMGDGAHLVGHSYGGLGALLAAARRPEATLSLTLLEPGAFALGQSEPAARALVDDAVRSGCCQTRVGFGDNAAPARTTARTPGARTRGASLNGLFTRVRAAVSSDCNEPFTMSVSLMNESFDFQAPSPHARWRCSPPAIPQPHDRPSCVRTSQA